METAYMMLKRKEGRLIVIESADEASVVRVQNLFFGIDKFMKVRQKFDNFSIR
jgi:hypothetical protein